MGKYMNRASAQAGSLVGLQLETEKTNKLLQDILTELRHANAREDAATAGPPATLASR